jgi:hypothetical protein
MENTNIVENKKSESMKKAKHNYYMRQIQNPEFVKRNRERSKLFMRKKRALEKNKQIEVIG